MDKKRNLLFDVTGTLRQDILAKTNKQLIRWSLVMPEGEPIIRDFGLGNFENIGEVEFWLANNIEQGYCGKFIFLFDGQTCPYHYHKQKHETFFIVRGEVTMNINGNQQTMKEGALMEMETETWHSFIAKGNALVLEVSKPSIWKDSFFEDKRLGVF